MAEVLVAGGNLAPAFSRGVSQTTPQPKEIR